MAIIIVPIANLIGPILSPAMLLYKHAYSVMRVKAVVSDQRTHGFFIV